MQLEKKRGKEGKNRIQWLTAARSHMFPLTYVKDIAHTIVYFKFSCLCYLSIWKHLPQSNAPYQLGESIWTDVVFPQVAIPYVLAHLLHSLAASFYWH